MMISQKYVCMTTKLSFEGTKFEIMFNDIRYAIMLFISTVKRRLSDKFLLNSESNIFVWSILFLLRVPTSKYSRFVHRLLNDYSSKFIETKNKTYFRISLIVDYGSRRKNMLFISLRVIPDFLSSKRVEMVSFTTLIISLLEMPNFPFSAV